MPLVRLALSFLLTPPLFLLAALCAGAAVTGHFGRERVAFDVLNQFAPAWLTGAAVALILGLTLLRGLSRWLVIAMAAVGVAAALALVAPEYLRDTGPKAPADAPDRIKLIQFNVWDRNPDIPGTVDWLARQDADIIVLEEPLPELREALVARTGLHVVCEDCDVSILSKAAPLPGRSGRLYPRGVGPISYATYRDLLGEFTVIGVHNAWPTDGNDQQNQEAQLARGIASFPRDRTIVSGDFNSAPWSYSRRRWDHAFGLIRRDRAVFSWPAGKMTRRRYREPVAFLPIDHVFAGPQWATVSLERGARLGSDHYPLIAVLAPVSGR